MRETLSQTLLVRGDSTDGRSVTAFARSSRSRPWRSRLPALIGLGALVAGTPAWAQGTPPRLLVSTTSDVAAFEDADLIAVGGGAAVAPSSPFRAGHWLGATGLAPGDVDALALRPGSVPGSAGSLAFSLLSNEGGVLDGDVLGIAPGGGLEVVVDEATLLAGLGAPGANIDVNALDFDDAGRLLFSVQTDLPGTVVGTVEDGDVLRLELDGSVSRVLSELDVQTKFAIATGLPDAIGEVNGVEWIGGEVWVTTQGPSSHDGGVLACGATPAIVTDEAALGLGGAELDALSVLAEADEIAYFVIDIVSAPAGSAFNVEFFGAPNAVQLVLMAGGTGFFDFSHAPGFGAWFLDPLDPWLNSVVAAPSLPLVFLDGSGSYQTGFSLPVASFSGTGFGGESGWSFQMVDLSTLEVSAPYRIEMP